jgi:hypothetical protein
MAWTLKRELEWMLQQEMASALKREMEWMLQQEMASMLKRIRHRWSCSSQRSRCPPLSYRH